MSYILEALKKSEAERNRNNAAMQLMSEAPAPSARVWPKALGVALAINAVAVSGVWYWLQGGASAPFSAPTPATLPMEAPPRAAASAPVQPAAAEDPAPAAAQPPSAAISVRARPDSDSAVVRFRSLPSSERASFPELSFSTHLYASDPALRRVVVNGRRAQEGDTVAGSIYIEQITETGVIVHFRDRRVALDVIQDWRL
jgi:general secretion pathway protein B